MSAESSPTTPKAKPTKLTTSSPPPPDTHAVDDMQNFKTRRFSQGFGERFSNAHNLTPTIAQNPTQPRSSFKQDARARLDSTQLSPFVRPTVDNSSGGGVYVAADGSLVRSSAGFKAGTVPGNYRSPFDSNMVHRPLGLGRRAVVQQRNAPLNLSSEDSTPCLQPAPAALAPSSALGPSFVPADVSAPHPSVVAPTATPQVQAIVPPQGTPLRLVLLGPLRMIRSQCAAKPEILRPILVWLDRFMGEELRTPVYTDNMISNVVYAVYIPMNEEHWRDWKKVLAVFPRAAAWEAALTPKEPFDQVTAGHPTANIFVSGKPLESLLDDLVEKYDLGAQSHPSKP